MERGADAKYNQRIRDIEYRPVQELRGSHRNCWATCGALLFKIYNGRKSLIKGLLNMRTNGVYSLLPSRVYVYALFVI